MQDFYVYMLRCSDGSYYVGHTDNIEKRLFEHQNSEMKCYTSTRLPVELVFVDATSSRFETLENQENSKHKKNGKIITPFESLRANGEKENIDDTSSTRSTYKNS